MSSALIASPIGCVTSSALFEFLSPIAVRYRQKERHWVNKVVKTNYLKILFEKEVSFSPISGFSDVSAFLANLTQEQRFSRFTLTFKTNDNGLFIDLSKRMEGNK